MSLKCFLCTKEFEGSESMTDLSSSQISFMFQVFHISPDDTEKDLLRLKFQNVCYCSECFEMISNLSGLAAELEVLEEIVSTEKRNVVDRLRQSTAKFSQKINGPPGMLQMLRTEIIFEIDNVCARKRRKRKSAGFSNTSEVKKQSPSSSESTQTDYIYDNQINSCRQNLVSEDRFCDNVSNSANSNKAHLARSTGTGHESNLLLHLNECEDDDPDGNLIRSGFKKISKILKHKNVLKRDEASPKCDPIIGKRDRVVLKGLSEVSKLSSEISKQDPKSSKQDPIISGPIYPTRKKPKQSFDAKPKSKQSKTCKECGKVFSRLTNLNKHVMVIHRDRRIYQCQLCDFSSLSLTELKDHMVTRHSGTKRKRFRCNLCDQSFERIQNLQRHKKGHNGYTPFKCVLCHGSFKSYFSLAKHRRWGDCLRIA